MNKSRPNIAIVGATGAVGKKLLQVLEQRKFPVGDIILLASERSSGKQLKFKNRIQTVRKLGKESFKNVSISFFCAGSEISRKYADTAVKSGSIVIDNSSAYRNDDKVPLIVPEINPGDIKFHHGIISNPNCTTAIMLTVLNPIHRFSAIKRVSASTYQSVSGAGERGVCELKDQIKAVSRGQDTEAEVFTHRIVNNIIPHIGEFESDGYTKEELKMLNETKKILHDRNIKISATCVRVPVISVHSMALTIITKDDIDVQQIRKILKDAPGVIILDDAKNNSYPMPLNCADRYECFAGRIRKDMAFKNGISMWVCGDQLLKGAALNAVQIAELVL
ncbi:MAG: aspartate-semialdehyde dehydrogenase [Candidatus Delongbacteria bacterium]